MKIRILKTAYADLVADAGGGFTVKFSDPVWGITFKGKRHASAEEAKREFEAWHSDVCGTIDAFHYTPIKGQPA